MKFLDGNPPSPPLGVDPRAQLCASPRDRGRGCWPADVFEERAQQVVVDHVSGHRGDKKAGLVGLLFLIAAQSRCRDGRLGSQMGCILAHSMVAVG